MLFVFSFEPEVFPALIYRMVKPRAVFLMFVNGKVVLTGDFTIKNFKESSIFLNSNTGICSQQLILSNYYLLQVLKQNPI